MMFFLFPNPKNSMYVHRVECFFELYSYIVLLSSTKRTSQTSVPGKSL